jgi:hypothetical protein
MDISLRPSNSAPGDPVCACIENCLNDLDRSGVGRLQRHAEGSEVRVSFGSHSASSVSYEVALVRLAMAMLDDVQYARVMRSALRPHMQLREANS